MGETTEDMLSDSQENDLSNKQDLRRHTVKVTVRAQRAFNIATDG
jgi:hypothetical protein